MAVSLDNIIPRNPPSESCLLTFYLRVNQVVGNVKRGTVTAFAGSLGQFGGIISALVFPSSDGPYYVPGISVCIGFQVMGILVALNMWLCCSWENRQRELGKRDHLRDLPQDEIDKLGERHPDFRYTT